MNENYLGIIFALTASILWSITVTLIKPISQNVSPFLINPIKNSIGLILFFISFIILIFNFCALLYLEPGFSPHTKKLVFLLTDPVTRPPFFSISTFASFLDSSDNVPVITKICSFNLLDFCFGIEKFTPNSKTEI